MKKKLMRSGRDQKLGGVCAGAGIVAYLILWAIAPVSDEF